VDAKAHCQAHAFPEQAAAILITHWMVGVAEFFFEIFEIIVVQVKLPLQGAVRHTPPASQHIEHLIQDFLERHGYFSF
jgi:hypothetical protein